MTTLPSSTASATSTKPPTTGKTAPIAVSSFRAYFLSPLRFRIIHTTPLGVTPPLEIACGVFSGLTSLQFTTFA